MESNLIMAMAALIVFTLGTKFIIQPITRQVFNTLSVETAVRYKIFLSLRSFTTFEY